MTSNGGVNLSEKFALFDEHWSPKIVGRVNTLDVKVVKLLGEFVWHTHEDTDEVFIVLEGELTIAFRDEDASLKTGELLVIPRGVAHRPVAASQCHVLLVEPRGVVNTGDAGGPLTPDNDVWI